MTSSRSFDVIVVGGGIVALATARSLASEGFKVFLSAPEHPGTSSPLAAGVLGPTIEPASGAAFEFSRASRDRYPTFAASLADETGIDVQLDLAGVLRLALTEKEEEELKTNVSVDVHWLLPAEVHDLEPALTRCVGALFHFRDGIVANERVHSALRASVRRKSRIQWTSRAVREVEVTDRDATITLDDESRLSANSIVIAAGAWSAGISGLPSPPTVMPLRGQMVSVAGVGLRRAVYGAGGYLTPRRDGRILSGSTQELAGFDPGTLPDDLERLDRVSAALLPSMAPMTRIASWAGLRPMSPDGLPIIDRDPLAPQILYATGHTRNGILMGPLTADVITDLVCGRRTAFDLSPFSLGRFSANSFA